LPDSTKTRLAVRILGAGAVRSDLPSGSRGCQVGKGASRMR
jgi:hypothetical protein